jgi:hypothetical protein
MCLKEKSNKSHGTVQGSILGQILNAILVSSMFRIADLDTFADDMFIPEEGMNLCQT